MIEKEFKWWFISSFFFDKKSDKHGKVERPRKCILYIYDIALWELNMCWVSPRKWWCHYFYDRTNVTRNICGNMEKRANISSVRHTTLWTLLSGMKFLTWIFQCLYVFVCYSIVYCLLWGAPCTLRVTNPYCISACGLVFRPSTTTTIAAP